MATQQFKNKNVFVDTCGAKYEVKTDCKIILQNAPKTMGNTPRVPLLLLLSREMVKKCW